MASMHHLRFALAALVIPALLVLVSAAVAAEAVDDAPIGPYKNLEYRLIGPAGNYRCSGSKSRLGRGLCADLSNNIHGIIYFGQKISGNSQAIQQFSGPASVGDIKQQGAGCIRCICGDFSAESEADLVLGKHHFVQGLKGFQLVRFDP